MPHPRDHRHFSTSFDGHSLRPRHRAATNRCGVTGDGVGKPLGDIGVTGSKIQESNDRFTKVLNIRRLFLLPSPRIRFATFRIGIC